MARLEERSVSDLGGGGGSREGKGMGGGGAKEQGFPSGKVLAKLPSIAT